MTGLPRKDMAMSHEGKQVFRRFQIEDLGRIYPEYRETWSHEKGRIPGTRQ
jgi:hypothetical protein